MPSAPSTPAKQEHLHSFTTAGLSNIRRKIREENIGGAQIVAFMSGSISRKEPSIDLDCNPQKKMKLDDKLLTILYIPCNLFTSRWTYPSYCTVVRSFANCSNYICCILYRFPWTVHSYDYYCSPIMYWRHKCIMCEACSYRLLASLISCKVMYHLSEKYGGPGNLADIQLWCQTSVIKSSQAWKDGLKLWALLWLFIHPFITIIFFPLVWFFFIQAIELLKKTKELQPLLEGVQTRGINNIHR